MKNYLYILSFLFLSYSCTDGFEDLNKNGNRPEKVAPDLLLPYIVYTAADTRIEGSIITQHIAARNFINMLMLGRYEWYSTPVWDYDLLRNVNSLIKEAENVGNNNFKGIGLIYKSYLFSRTTDCVGDIPYSEALKGKEGLYTAKYDTQEDVYKGLLADLEYANELLDVNGIDISGDILYNGDILKWKKFANSLHLRLLMRVSDKMPEAKVKIKTIIDNPAKYPIFESNSDMAVLSYLPDSPNRYPHYNENGYEAGEVVMGKPLVDTMLKYNDARLQVIAQPTKASVEAGTPEYIGTPCAVDNDIALNYNGGLQKQSLISRRYSQEPNTEKAIFMSYSELQFILAEAAQKGWITGLGAKKYYENGIKGSFGYYDIQSKADAYLLEPSVVFDSQKGLQQIGIQKWMSFFFNSGFEVFFDIRRTGIPYLYPGDSNKNGGKIPVRWKYPDSEQLYNYTKYKDALSRQGDDNINTPIWLTK